MTTIDKQHVATLLGLTTRRVETLAADGVLVKGKGGDFDMERSVRGYVEFLRRDEATQIERRKLLAAQTEATRVRALRATGQLHTLADVRRRLEPILENLWALRGVCSWYADEVQKLTDGATADRLYRRQHSDLSHRIAGICDAIYAEFPRRDNGAGPDEPVAEQAEGDDAKPA